MDYCRLLIDILTSLADLNDECLLVFLLKVSTALRSINVNALTNQDCIIPHTIIVLYYANPNHFLGLVTKYLSIDIHYDKWKAINIVIIINITSEIFITYNPNAQFYLTQYLES
jgi:multidrug transporter EmrE-like cation transporter